MSAHQSRYAFRDAMRFSSDCCKARTRTLSSYSARIAGRSNSICCRGIKQQSARIGARQALPQRLPPSRIQQRHLSLSWTQTREAFRNAYREHPFSLPFAIFMIISLLGSGVYLESYYRNYIIAAFSAFPEPVAAKLRRALYFTNISYDMEKANKYYHQALLVAAEVGMDPYSAEVVGIKLQAADMFAKGQAYHTAIDVLELVRRDCAAWLAAQGAQHLTDGRRTVILATLVRVDVRLGELYAADEVGERELAQDRLVSAVETLLGERERRRVEGVKEGEGEWLGAEECGAAMERLAHSYEERDLHYLATPLFLQALALAPPKSCHAVVLMNNLAISLAQQQPPPATLPSKVPSSSSPDAKETYTPFSRHPTFKPQTPPPTPPSLPLIRDPATTAFPATPPPSSTTLLLQSRAWASRAVSLAAAVPAPDRSAECDEGCAAALHNLGEVAEMLGEWREARESYGEAEGKWRAMGSREGVERAREGLGRVDGKVGKGR